MDGPWNDLRYAARGLRRAPGFTTVAIVTLALGVGATGAVFNALEASLRRSLPFPEPDRLVHLWETTAETGERQLSFPDFRDLVERSRTLDVAAYGFYGATLETPEGVIALDGARVSAGFFDVLGVRPALGRGFRPEEDRPGRARDVVVLSDAAWRRRFGADPAILGRALELSGQNLTVIGVLPPDFQFGRAGDPELFVTLSPPAELAERRITHFLYAIGRLRPGAAIEATRAELATIAAARAADDPRWHGGSGLAAVPLRDAILGPVRPLLAGMLAGAVLVLLVACANVAAMSLARVAGRERELALRAALGAGRARLARLFLAESLLLALAGGAAGLLVAVGAARALVATLPAERARFLPFLRELEPRPALFLFSLLACLAAGAATALLPAWRSIRKPAAALAGGRGASRRSDGRGFLVAAEVAGTFVLVAAAGLVGASLRALLAVDAGLPRAELLTAQVALPAGGYETPAERASFFAALHDRLVALPGASGAGFVDRLPLESAGNTGTPTIVGRAPSGADSPEAQLRVVSAGYFAAVDLPVVAGRAFGDEDGPERPPVAIVNRRFVEEILGGASAVGERLTFAFLEPGEPPFEIVGVVGDEAVGDLDDGRLPAIYFPQAQQGGPSMRLVLRTAGDPALLARPLAAAVRELEPAALVDEVVPLERRVEESPPVVLRRLPLLLVGAYAALALVLAAVGVYGVLARYVGERTRELGIRRAIGARTGDLHRLVLARALRWTAAGLAVGLAGAVAAGFALSRLLYATSPLDPVVLAGTAVVLTLVAVAACLVPMRRATRVDPAVALRCE